MTYAEIVLDSYTSSVSSATHLHDAINALLTNPSERTLDDIRQSCAVLYQSNITQRNVRVHLSQQNWIDNLNNNCTTDDTLIFSDTLYF